MMVTWGLLIAIGVVGLFGLGVVLWAVGAYNRLVSLRQRNANGFAQIDVQLKRRYDLIPNLIEVAKKYMAHERETLEAVIAARNQASAASQAAAATPGSPKAIKDLIGAEGLLGGAMLRFNAVAEQYPDLKANANMMQLTEELTSTENKIAFARQAFNDAVMHYNVYREQFPSNLIAGFFHFERGELFEIRDDAEREAVKVRF